MSSRTLIVILTWNRFKLTRKTLKSLFEFNKKEDVPDILFIDNGSTDGTTKKLEKLGYEVIKNKSNEGIFKASTKAWLEGVDRGYDFILNLQNDFPCTGAVPFKAMEDYLDSHDDVGFIRLNKKKDKKRTIFKEEPVRYFDKEKLGEHTIEKCNYHCSFNPNLMKSSLIKYLSIDNPKPRERGIVEEYFKLNLHASKLGPSVFDTLPQGTHAGDWTR